MQWTNYDERRAMTLYEEGIPLKKISKLTGHSINAIVSRRMKLGVAARPRTTGQFGPKKSLRVTLTTQLHREVRAKAAALQLTVAAYVREVLATEMLIERKIK